MRFWRLLTGGLYREVDHRCEVCGCGGVDRRGVWDYCPVGHVYVGHRAEEER